MHVDDDASSQADCCDCGMINHKQSGTYVLRRSVLAARVLKTADLRQSIADLSPCPRTKWRAGTNIQTFSSGEACADLG